MNNSRLWTKDFVAVAIVNFLLTFVMFLLLVNIPSYAAEQFNASASLAGLISGIFIIGALIGRVFIGRVIGNMGAKRVLLMGGVFYAITSIFYLGAINIPFLIVNRLLHGVAFGISSTAAATIMAQIIPHNRRGEGIGYYSMSSILATAIGPFLGLFLSHITGFTTIFIMNTVLTLVGLAISFMLSNPNVANSSAEKQNVETKRFQISDFLELKAIRISLISLFIGFSFSGILAFISFYCKEIHLEKSAGFFFLVYSIAIIVSRPFSGRLFDIKGANIVVYPSILFFALGMLLLSQVNDGVTLLIVAVLVGLGYGNYQSSAQALAMKGVEPHRLGLATATFYIFVDLGIGTGSYILGFFVPLTGYRGLYLAIFFILLTTLALYYFFLGRKLTNKQI